MCVGGVSDAATADKSDAESVVGFGDDCDNEAALLEYVDVFMPPLT